MRIQDKIIIGLYVDC